LKGYGTVWFYPDRILNIFSLCNVQKKYKVTYYSSMKTGLLAHKVDGTNGVFMPSKMGLFFSEAKMSLHISCRVIRMTDVF